MEEFHWSPKDTWTEEQTTEALAGAIDKIFDIEGYGISLLDCEHSYCKDISDELKEDFHRYANYQQKDLTTMADFYADLYKDNIAMLQNTFALFHGIIDKKR